MQVVYEDKRLQHVEIDSAKVKGLLLAQGIKEESVAPLIIHLAYEVSEEEQAHRVAQGRCKSPWGLYIAPNDIYVYSHDRVSPMGLSLNKTLLHELRHHIKGGYRSGEEKLPYEQRPSEIDAFAFAVEQAPLHTLVTIPGESPISPTTDVLMQILAIEVVTIGLLTSCIFIRGLAHWLKKKGV